MFLSKARKVSEESIKLAPKTKWVRRDLSEKDLADIAHFVEDFIKAGEMLPEYDQNFVCYESVNNVDLLREMIIYLRGISATLPNNSQLLDYLYQLDHLADALSRFNPKIWQEVYVQVEANKEHESGMHTFYDVADTIEPQNNKEQPISEEETPTDKVNTYEGIEKVDLITGTTKTEIPIGKPSNHKDLLG